VAGLTALTFRVGPRTAAIVGYLAGLGLLVPTMSFLRGIGVDAWLVVAAIEALWYALLAVGLAVSSRLAVWPVAVPLVWVAIEWLRDRWPFGGFPWARLAFGQAGGPLLPLAAWGGAPLVAAVVATLGVVVLVLLRTVLPRLRATEGLTAARAGRAGWAGGVAAVAAGVACFGAAAAIRVPTAGTSEDGPSTVVVAAVQGNVPRLGLDAFAQRRAVTANHVAATEALAARVLAGTSARPTFVVWPENASDQDPYVDPEARALIEQAVASVGVPVLVGAVVNGPDARHVRNTAIVWSPATGPGETYVKQHLVPFGEYLPLRSVLTRLVGRFSLIAKDFSPGHRPGVLDIGGVRVADAICFEVADDGVVRSAVAGGGRLLIVQTNNATYERPGDDGGSGETAQQLQISRLRAVEHGRAVVVAATSGVSAIIAPDGAVLQRTRVFTQATLEARLPLRDARTLADRLGAWPERVLAVLGALAVLLGLRRHADIGPRHRPQPADAAPVLAGSP
jgi:apolipoprotein N-acyltransferase